MYLLLKRFLNGYAWKYFLSGLLDLSVTCVFSPLAEGKSGSTPLPGPGVLSHVQAQDVTMAAGETAEGSTCFRTLIPSTSKQQNRTAPRAAARGSPI